MRNRRTVEGVKSTEEIVYYLSSLPAKVKTFAKAVRAHWGIENQLALVPRCNFCRRIASRVAEGSYSPLNLSMLRRLALAILRKDTSIKDSLRGKRLRAGWDEEVLLQLLTGFSGK